MILPKRSRSFGETAMVHFPRGAVFHRLGYSSGVAACRERRGLVFDSQSNQPVVQLNLTEEGKTLFAAATQEMIGQVISIWMDDQLLSYPTVNEAITDGHAIISGMGSTEAAQELADKINAGSLPFALKVDDTIQVINPTLASRPLT